MERSLLILMLFATVAHADVVRDELFRSPVATLGGDEADLVALEGKTIVVNFWAEWCAPCRRELPVLDNWFGEYADRGVAFVPISIDRDRRKAARWADRLELDLPLYHDGPEDLAARLDLPALPITYVVGPDGRTVFTSTGSDEAALAALRTAIESTLASAEAAR